MKTEEIAHFIKSREFENLGYTDEMEERWLMDKLHEVLKGREERL